jgi:hypothetical protein
MLIICSAFACVYVPQTLLKKRLPYGVGAKILGTTIVASAASYYITTEKTKVCQAAWLAVEDKHTYFTRLEQEDRARNSNNDS